MMLVSITWLVLWTGASYTLAEKEKVSSNEVQKLNHFGELSALEAVNRDPFPLLSRSVRSGEDIPPPTRILNVCDVKSPYLNHGESILIYSENNGEKIDCKVKIQSPPGTKVGFYCPQVFFNMIGCQKEQILLTAYIHGRKARQPPFCKNAKPLGTYFDSNAIFIHYKRQKLVQQQRSGGFICQVYTAEGSG